MCAILIATNLMLSKLERYNVEKFTRSRNTLGKFFTKNHQSIENKVIKKRDLISQPERDGQLSAFSWWLSMLLLSLVSTKRVIH